MISDPDGFPERDEEVCEVLAAYFEALKAGVAPERKVWLARHPELASELDAFLVEEDRLLRMTGPLRSIVEEARTPSFPPRWPGASGEEAAPDWTAAPLPVVGDYVLLGEIDRGGVGIVYRARQGGLNRTVALKMLRAGALADGDDVRRFRFEAEAVAQLDHPNIVPVFEVGDHDGSSYLAMKLIEGASLARRLGDYAGEPREAAGLVASVARAIHHAHRRGILHRDLKPSNILIDAEGQPHVTDFGLARRVADDSDRTRSGSIIGTASYMAPEQATGRRGASTVATDVYGLGAVLYALLAGRPPFQGDSALEILDRVRRQDPEPPREAGRVVDRDLETICLKCLDKEPGRRYDSALALAEDLGRWLRGEPIAARPVGRVERSWRWCRRNPLAAALAALAAAGVVGLALGNRLLAAQRDEAQRHSRRAAENLAEARLQRQRQAYNFSIMLERAARLVEVLRGPKPDEGPELTALRAGMTEQALDLIRVFLEERGDDPTMRIEAVYAHRVLGSTYRAVSTREQSYAEFRRARDLAERLVADYPDISPYRVELGRINDILAHHLEEDGDLAGSDVCFREAEAQFTRAAELEPSNANALNMLAWQFANSAPPRFRDPGKALYWARRALAVARDQEAGRVWDTLGIAYYRNGDWPAAIEALETSCRVRADRGNDHTFFALAMAYWRAGLGEEAAWNFDRAVRWNTHRSIPPENAPLYAEASRLLGLTAADIAGG